MIGKRRRLHSVTSAVPHPTRANYWNVTLMRNGDDWEVEWSTAVLIDHATSVWHLLDPSPCDDIYEFYPCVNDIVKSIIVDYVKSYAVITSQDENTVHLHCNNGVNEWDITWQAEMYRRVVAKFQAALVHCDAATLAMSDQQSWIFWSSLKF